MYPDLITFLPCTCHVAGAQAGSSGTAANTQVGRQLIVAHPAKAQVLKDATNKHYNQN